MTVKLACARSWLLCQSSHPTSQVTSWPVIVALDCWSLLVLGFSHCLNWNMFMLPLWPPIPHIILLSLFRTCLEVVRFVSLRHRQKAFIITLFVKGMTKGEGSWVLEEGSGLYSQKVWKSKPLVDADVWINYFYEMASLCHMPGKVRASSLLCIIHMCPFSWHSGWTF